MNHIFLFFLHITLVFSMNAQEAIYVRAYGPIVEIDFNDRNSDNYIYIDSTQAGNIWQIGQAVKPVFDSGYFQPLALVTDTMNTYLVGNRSSFELLVEADDLMYLHFWHRYDTDSLHDGGVVEFSKDDGQTWHNVISEPEMTLGNFYQPGDSLSSADGQQGFTGYSSEWKESDISTYLGFGSGECRFRFTFFSDSLDNGRDGWMFGGFVCYAIGTGIGENLLDEKINIYPNPSYDLFSIDLPFELKILKVRVYDHRGACIYEEVDKNIDARKWNPGSYLMEITTDKGVAYKNILRVRTR